MLIDLVRDVWELAFLVSQWANYGPRASRYAGRRLESSRYVDGKFDYLFFMNGFGDQFIYHLGYPLNCVPVWYILAIAHQVFFWPDGNSLMSSECNDLLYKVIYLLCTSFQSLRFVNRIYQKGTFIKTDPWKNLMEQLKLDDHSMRWTKSTVFNKN